MMFIYINGHCIRCTGDGLPYKEHPGGPFARWIDENVR